MDYPPEPYQQKNETKIFRETVDLRMGVLVNLQHDLLLAKGFDGLNAWYKEAA
jgi:hypothetical protein